MRGSLLTVDRSLTPEHGNIIITSVNNELALRRLLLIPSSALQELYGNGELVPLMADFDLSVWGVVSYALTCLAGLGFNTMLQE